MPSYALLATLVRPAPIAPTVLADPRYRCRSAQLVISGDRHLLAVERFAGFDIVSVAVALQRVPT